MKRYALYFLILLQVFFILYFAYITNTLEKSLNQSKYEIIVLHNENTELIKSINLLEEQTQNNQEVLQDIEELKEKSLDFVKFRENYILKTIGEQPTIKNLTVFNSKEEVLSKWGEPNNITYEFSPYEKWTYDGATVYFIDNEVFQVNTISNKYKTSFGVNVGDPLKDLTLDDSEEFIHWFNGKYYIGIYSKNGVIYWITLGRDSS